MFSFQRLASSVGIIVPQCTSLSMNFSVCHCLLSRKRHSPYSSVDTGRYSSLVKSIMSVRVSSQTPETLKDEDEQIYGPVIKAQMSSPGPQDKLPKTLHPFLLDNDSMELDDVELGPPTQIILNRGPGRGPVPSVTRILQQTLSPDQLFYLERWKKKMIAELGEEGFAKYSQSKFLPTKFHFLFCPLWPTRYGCACFCNQICSSRGSCSIQFWKTFCHLVLHGRVRVLRRKKRIPPRFRDTWRASPTSSRTSELWEPLRPLCTTTSWTIWALQTASPVTGIFLKVCLTI